jgi:hypothetical protein
MSAAFWASYVLLWLLVGLFAILILLLYRQFGLMFLSSRERMTMQGLDLGATARTLRFNGPKGMRELGWGAAANGFRARLLVFSLPTCPICSDLASDAAALPERWKDVEFVWIDGTVGGRAPRAVDASKRWTVGGAVDDALHQEWDVSAVPFAFVVARDGTVLAKTVPNTADELNELLASSLSSNPLAASGGRSGGL